MVRKKNSEESHVKGNNKTGKQGKTEVKEVSGADFDAIIKSNEFVVVDFFAEWCMPCLMMVPVIDELAQSYSKRVVFVKMNVDENQQVAERFKVMSIPTLIIFKRGEDAGRITGASSYDILKERIDSYLKS